MRPEVELLIFSDNRIALGGQDGGRRSALLGAPKDGSND
jgi:hypothetical protein